jgi:membrane protein DedA with SNARE-associated domain
MYVLLTVVSVMIWVAIAFWPARVAGRKGHSFLGYFIFSLVFFPAALIVAYLVQDRTVLRDRPAPTPA